MAASGYWVIRTYVSGSVGEKIKYWVPGQRPTRSERRLKAEIRKQQSNEASAVKRLARCLNANFTHADQLIGLDYSDEGLKRLEAGIPEGLDEAERFEAMRKAAERELRNCLRRVKRSLPEGTAFRYVAVTSDMDGKTGETVRLHHHLVVGGRLAEVIREKWKSLGGCFDVQLRRMEDYTPLAEYLLDQVRRVPDEKKYMCSRNMVRPRPTDRIARNGSLLRAPAGCVLVAMNEYKPGAPQYIRYLIRRKE